MHLCGTPPGIPVSRNLKAIGNLSTSKFVCAVHTVSLPITQELLGDAAFAISTAKLTALAGVPTVLLVRPVLTLGRPVAHQRFRNTFLSMGALKLA